jgi:integrase
MHTCRVYIVSHYLGLHVGAKPRVISEAPGHASVAFTMDTYSHIISGMQEDAISLLDEVLPPGVDWSGRGASKL